MGVCKLLNRISVWNMKWLCEGLYPHSSGLVWYWSRCTVKSSQSRTPKLSLVLPLMSCLALDASLLGPCVRVSTKTIGLLHCFLSAGLGAPTSADLKMPHVTEHTDEMLMWAVGVSESSVGQ